MPIITRSVNQAKTNRNGKSQFSGCKMLRTVLYVVITVVEIVIFIRMESKGYSNSDKFNKGQFEISLARFILSERRSDP